MVTDAVPGAKPRSAGSAHDKERRRLPQPHYNH
jgi:hypothetical protein